MSFLPSLLLTLSLVLSTSFSQAQQTPIAPDSTTQPAISPAVGTQSGAATDVIVRTNGDELPARVLRITPQLVRYLPLPPATDSLGQATAADTLQLAATDVFMVRFANGTREVLRAAPAPAPGASLVGLSTAQRTALGRQDSRKYYKADKGVFWGTFAATVTTFYGGPVVGGAIALTPPKRYNLNAPQPDLLNDPAYYDGYRREAQKRKLGKAAGGLGVGLGTLAVLTTALILILLGSTTHI